MGKFEYLDDDSGEPIIFEYWADTRWEIWENRGKKYILSPAFWNDGQLEARFALYAKRQFNLSVFIKKTVS